MLHKLEEEFAIRCIIINMSIQLWSWTQKTSAYCLAHVFSEWCNSGHINWDPTIGDTTRNRIGSKDKDTQSIRELSTSENSVKTDNPITDYLSSAKHSDVRYKYLAGESASVVVYLRSARPGKKTQHIPRRDGSEASVPIPSKKSTWRGLPFSEGWIRYVVEARRR